MSPSCRWQPGDCGPEISQTRWRSPLRSGCKTPQRPGLFSPHGPSCACRWEEPGQSRGPVLPPREQACASRGPVGSTQEQDLDEKFAGVSLADVSSHCTWSLAPIPAGLEGRQGGGGWGQDRARQRWGSLQPRMGGEDAVDGQCRHVSEHSLVMAKCRVRIPARPLP